MPTTIGLPRSKPSDLPCVNRCFGGEVLRSKGVRQDPQFTVAAALVLLRGATRAGIVAPELGDAAPRFRSAATGPGLPIRSEMPLRPQKSRRHVRDRIFPPVGADRLGQHHLAFAVLRKRVILRIRQPPSSMFTWKCEQGSSRLAAAITGADAGTGRRWFQRKDHCAHSGCSRTGIYSWRYLRRTPFCSPVAAFVNSTLSS
jgi:hypothetical protein